MRGFAAAILLAASLLGARAMGHAMPNSTVVVASTWRGVDAAVVIPLSELAAALGHAPSPEAGRAELEGYVRAHVSLLSADGRAWPLSIRGMTATGGEHPALALRLVFARPAAAKGPAVLHYDAVNHRIASHFVLVYRRGGFGGLQPLARLQFPQVTAPLAAVR